MAQIANQGNLLMVFQGCTGVYNTEIRIKSISGQIIISKYYYFFYNIITKVLDV